MTELRPLKGQKGGNCNVTACQLFRSLDPDKIGWYNHSTQKYYCRDCATDINRANRKDAMALWGHDICTLSLVDEIKTIEQFAEFCRKLPHDPNAEGPDEIFHLFEDEIDKDLQAQMYKLALDFDPEDTEPARGAFIQIGTKYGVESLIKW